MLVVKAAAEFHCDGSPESIFITVFEPDADGLKVNSKTCSQWSSGNRSGKETANDDEKNERGWEEQSKHGGYFN